MIGLLEALVHTNSHWTSNPSFSDAVDELKILRELLDEIIALENPPVPEPDDDDDSLRITPKVLDKAVR